MKIKFDDEMKIANDLISFCNLNHKYDSLKIIVLMVRLFMVNGEAGEALIIIDG